MAEEPKFNKLKTITLEGTGVLAPSGQTVRQLKVLKTEVDNAFGSTGPSVVVGPTGATGARGYIGPTGPTGADGNPNMILISPNGSEYLLEVENNGTLKTTLLNSGTTTNTRGN